MIQIIGNIDNDYPDIPLQKDRSQFIGQQLDGKTATSQVNQYCHETQAKTF